MSSEPRTPRTSAGRALAEDYPYVAKGMVMRDGKSVPIIVAIEAEARALALDEARTALDRMLGVEVIEDKVGVRRRAIRDALAAIDRLRDADPPA